MVAFWWIAKAVAAMLRIVSPEINSIVDRAAFDGRMLIQRARGAIGYSVPPAKGESTHCYFVAFNLPAGRPVLRTDAGGTRRRRHWAVGAELQRREGGSFGMP